MEECPRTAKRHALCALGEYYACMMEAKKKQQIIAKFQTHKGDTGSSEVQIALLSAEIEELIGHLKIHAKDHSSRRGLLRKVGARRSLMRYLKKEDEKSYENLMKKLKIKQPKVIAKPGSEKVTAEEDALDQEAELIEKENELVSE